MSSQMTKEDKRYIKEKEKEISDAEYNILSLTSLNTQINYRMDILLKEIYDKYISAKKDISLNKFKQSVRNNVK